MNIKILLTGDKTSCGTFLASLRMKLSIKLPGAASPGAMGTVSYRFQLGDDMIELLFLEEIRRLQKNYKNYSAGAKGIIFANAKDETQTALKSACGDSVFSVELQADALSNSLPCLQDIIKKCHTQHASLCANLHTHFYVRENSKQQGVTQERINRHPPELVAPNKVPPIAIHEIPAMDELKEVLRRRSGSFK